MLPGFRCFGPSFPRNLHVFRIPHNKTMKNATITLPKMIFFGMFFILCFYKMGRLFLFVTRSMSFSTLFPRRSYNIEDPLTHDLAHVRVHDHTPFTTPFIQERYYMVISSHLCTLFKRFWTLQIGFARNLSMDFKTSRHAVHPHIRDVFYTGPFLDGSIVLPSSGTDRTLVAGGLVLRLVRLTLVLRMERYMVFVRRKSGRLQLRTLVVQYDRGPAFRSRGVLVCMGNAKTIGGADHICDPFGCTRRRCDSKIRMIYYDIKLQDSQSPLEPCGTPCSIRIHPCASSSGRLPSCFWFWPGFPMVCTYPVCRWSDRECLEIFKLREHKRFLY